MATVLLKIPDVMERLSRRADEGVRADVERRAAVGEGRAVAPRASDELERFMAGVDDTRPNLRLPTPTQSRARAS